MDRPHDGAAATEREGFDGHRGSSQIACDREQRVRSADAGGGIQAEDVGVAAGGRDVEIGRAPDAAVDVLTAADRDRREQPRDAARRLDGLGDAGVRRARAPEHDPVAAPAVHAGHSQSAIPWGSILRDAVAEIGQLGVRPGYRRERSGAHQRAAGCSGGERDRRQRTPRRDCPITRALGAGKRCDDQSVGGMVARQLDVCAERARPAR